MKIALCLSGHMRTYQKCFESLKKTILDNFEIDVFIHTWDRIELKTICPEASNTWSQINIINDLFKPKKMVIEHFPINRFLPINQAIQVPISGRDDAYGFIGMFWSIKQANELRKQYELENNIQYDYVIRCRTDLFFYDQITFDHLPPSNTIYGGFQPSFYLSKIHPFLDIERKIVKKTDWIGDQFAIGDNHSMNTYCNTYDNLVGLSSKFGEFRPEDMVRQHLIDNHVQISALQVHFGMLRHDGNILILQ